LDFIAFFDSGVAWDSDSKPSFLGGGRKLLSSYGVGLRANIMGYLVAGVNFVKPLDRPNRDWHFEFSFWPGF
jgi:outer membrane protein assembly factor BamA